YTCYYARVLDTDLPLAIDVVSDMVVDSVNRPEDVEAERGVILEEIHMRDDDPGDLIHDEFAAALYGDTPLGRPILGTEESINALSRDRIHAYYREHYTPPNLVVSAAGGVDHDEVVRLVSRAFEGRLTGDAAPAPPRVDGEPAPVDPRTVVIEKDTEQTHIILGGAGASRTDERRFAPGRGRRRRGLAQRRLSRALPYSGYGHPAPSAVAGIFGVFAGCQHAKADEGLPICRGEIARAADEGLADEELERGKGQLRGA